MSFRVLLTSQFNAVALAELQKYSEIQVDYRNERSAIPYVQPEAFPGITKTHFVQYCGASGTSEGGSWNYVSWRRQNNY